ncbi:MAG: GTPase RsgA, partial [Muribaculaceae bacterium]|nr:GTPase RsgA [Muribaculaceae bacterium]
ISSTHHTGMHTTTFSEMHDLPGGGMIIDTPGVKGFGTIDFDVNEVAHYFPEIFRVSADCRYGNCTHTHEPGCAVLAAVENCDISKSRYASYLSILDDGKEDKYRKPF